MAWREAMRWTPIARVMVTIAGSPSGMAETAIPTLTELANEKTATDDTDETDEVEDAAPPRPGVEPKHPRAAVRKAAAEAIQAIRKGDQTGKKSAGGSSAPPSKP